jgi:hypothetical protein
MLVVRNLYEYQKNMIKFITSSEDYLNEWYNTRAWGILSLRRFRESIDTSINEIHFATSKHLMVLLQKIFKHYLSLRSL